MGEHMDEHLGFAVGLRTCDRLIGHMFFICSHSAKESTGVFTRKRQVEKPQDFSNLRVV